MDNSPASPNPRVSKGAPENHARGAGGSGAREGKSLASGANQSIVVVAFNRSGVSRTARPLRSRGHAVQTCSGVTTALDRLREGGVDLLVVERGDGDSGDGAIEFLHRVRSAGYATPSVLVATPNVELFTAAINEARVTRVVSADQDVDLLVDDIVLAADTGTAKLNEVESLRARCSTLEDKIDRLVSDSLQREGATRLLSDILVEIGNATGVEEVAGRCLARIVTILRLDMALIGLAPQTTGNARNIRDTFSFGCPRGILDKLRELSWSSLIAKAAATGDDERPFSLLELVGEPAAAALSRTMHLEGIAQITLYPLRARGTTLGFLGLGGHARREPSAAEWKQIEPVAKQVAIAIENSRLVNTATAAEAFATGVLQHLPSTVAICDGNGRLTSCYDDRQRLFAGRAVPGVTLAELLSEGEAEVIVDRIANVDRGADPISLRALHLSLPAGKKQVNVSIAAVPTGVMLIFDDITHRESIAGDLRRARALTSSLFANAPAGVLFLRHTSEVVDINETACTILNRDRKELLGRRLELLCPDLWRAMTLEANDGRGDVTLALSDGNHATVSFSTTRLGRRGGPAGLLLQIQDVGELEALREELRRKDNLALMGQMVSFIAHEIKNPLFGISSTAQVLARETANEETSRLSGAMLSEIERLGHMLEELLVFGSKRALSPIVGDPSVLCQEIATMHADGLAPRSITLNVDVTAPSIPIHFDPARLRQVIVNLVANAIDATPDGGTITISTREADGSYAIGVVNTGEAIPAGDIERLFDLFYSTKPGGSGLGLAICKKIIEDHGGQIEVSSSPTAGTLFAVHLPMARGEASEPT